MNTIELLKGDCLDKLKELGDNSVDSIVTDPPYMIGFMGKGWDSGDNNIVGKVELWQECLRVLKPGGHLLSFGATRTYHRMTTAIEDAGFEIRDCIFWCYGSGFPKSHNVGKNIEKIKVGGIKNLKQIGTKQGIKVETGTSGYSYSKEYVPGKSMGGKQISGDIPVYEITNEWEGWGTALKPAVEPIVMGRKPFKNNVAGNVLEWGTGGINIDGCRVGYRDAVDEKSSIPGSNVVNQKNSMFGINGETYEHNTEGRFPANLILDEEAGKVMDLQSGTTKSSKRGEHNNKKTEHTNTYTPPQAMYSDENTYGDSGGASRFFYCPKTSKKDRNEGCDKLEEKETRITNMTGLGRETTIEKRKTDNGFDAPKATNTHPTVKPTALMTYLIRLVTPKGGVVLDPFMGSGSTGKGAVREGMSFIGIEREDEYFQIAKSRIEYEQKKNKHSEFFDV